MSLESSTGLGVLSSYGPRAIEGKFGGQTADEVVKHVVYDFDYTDLNSTSAAAVQGLDYVFPVGTAFLRAKIVVETAVVGPTNITVGTYLASDGTTAINATGLFAATAVTALDAIGDVVDGAGAQLTTGTTAANGALQSAAVIRVLPTVAVATAGKFKLYVSYLAPTA